MICFPTQRTLLRLFFLVSVVLVLPVLASDPTAAAAASDVPWWVWPLSLFAITFVIGIMAVLGGVGGGVLFVPIVGGFFPFHLDFVRATGLLVALSGALSAGPGLLRSGLASLRLAIPVALIASASAIVGALLGLALPAQVIQICLGVTILGICVLMLTAKRSEYPEVPRADSLSTALRIYGIYHDDSSQQDVEWKIHRTGLSLILFIFIGIAAGMFGLGAGWANVPVLNMVMGVPLKLAVATSSFSISITDTAAAWVYINKGSVLPIMVVPCLLGIMLGAKIGGKLLKRAKPQFVRWMVIGILLLAGVRALLKGFGI